MRQTVLTLKMRQNFGLEHSRVKSLQSYVALYAFA